MKKGLSRRRIYQGFAVMLPCTLCGIDSVRSEPRVIQVSPPSPAENVPQLLHRADAFWKEKSYARALPLYQRALSAGSFSEAQRLELTVRVAAALGRSGRWDQAVAAGEELAKRHPNNARILYWMARLFQSIPHNGYRVGQRVYRGDNYPVFSSSERPEYVYLVEEDNQSTLEYLEKAKIAAQAERAVLQKPSLTRAGEIDLNFDLAAFVGNRETNNFIKALAKKQKLSNEVDLTQRYSRDWNMPRKALYLYNEIPRLDNSPRRHDTVLALLAKGQFVASYRQSLDQWATTYDEKHKLKSKKRYPFDHLRQIPIWQEILQRFAKDSDAARAQLLIAQTREASSEFVAALQGYRALTTKYAITKWVNDGRDGIQRITKRTLQLYPIGLQRPGVAGQMHIMSRNVRRINASVYAVQLERLISDPSRLNHPHIQFSTFDGNLGNITRARRVLGKKLASWSLELPDKRDHRPLDIMRSVPARNTGAYAVIVEAADAGHKPFLRSGTLLVLSDLAILKKQDRRKTLVYVADARTGRPVTGARIIVKSIYNDGRHERALVVRGVSDRSGFFETSRRRMGSYWTSGPKVFAWIGRRYALTGEANWDSWYGSETYPYSGPGKLYGYTDRPVYRPGQKVSFRQIYLRRIKGGDFRPAQGVTLRVEVRNPRYQAIFSRRYKTSEFGSVHDTLQLPAETPLGEYTITIYSVRPRIDGKKAENFDYVDQNRFRVEEYKRPEFLVTVEPPDKAVQPGQSVIAKVNLKYYFGSPVPHAKVKYKVRRGAWTPDYKFPQPYDWFYPDSQEDIRERLRTNIGGLWNGKLGKEGTATTDDKGNAEVTFEATEEPSSEEPNRALQPGEDVWADELRQGKANPLYTIEIEATDASRRTIEGQGSVRVARQEYFAFLDTKQGFYREGDRIKIELVTQDANDKPRPAPGKVIVYRQLLGEKETQVLAEDVATDKDGRLFWTWEARQAGTFRVVYEATDGWGKKVTASHPVWVGGPGLDVTQFRLRGVTILLEKRTYREGDTLKALLVADQPNTTLLFTEEGSNDIMRRGLLTIPRKNREITIRIGRQHSPNFFIAAALVKNFEVYQADQEIFVPPARQFINVSVHGDKSEYKPGEKGTFQIKATDWRGKPALAEVSLALTDASLSYIQKDYAPDIRLHYYKGRRYKAVNIDSHRSAYLYSREEDGAKYKNYQRHWDLMPQGLGQLNLPPGTGYGYYNQFETLSITGATASNVTFADGADYEHVRGMPAYEMAGESRFEAKGRRLANESLAQDIAGKIAYSSNGPYSFGATGFKTAGSPGPELPGLFAPTKARTNFAETAYWSPAVVTKGGVAKVTVTFPESLTKWQASARGLTTAAQVGAGEADTETRKNLLVRLQAPRFFVQRDQVVLTANVHNYLKESKPVRVSLRLNKNLKLSDEALEGISGTVLRQNSGDIEVKAGEETRVNWIIDVVKDGRAWLQMAAQTDVESDAMAMNFPVMVHGIQRTVTRTGVMRQPDGRQVVTIDVPRERREGATRLSLQLNPSLAATMLDALPYLMDYPYGCVEQTMSRFYPSVLVRKTLKDSGIDLDSLSKRAQAYEAEGKRRPIGDRIKNSGYTYPAGLPDSRDLDEMASRLWYSERRGGGAVYDKARLTSIIRKGLAKLYNAQRSDGGWGWWPESDESDPYMTAYVVYGLATAKKAGVSVSNDSLSSGGYSYLRGRLKHVDDLHLLAWISFVCSQQGSSKQLSPALNKLYLERESLSVYSKALLAIGLANSGDKVRSGVLIRNLENSVVLDGANGTARWRMGSEWWNWWNNDVETNAWVLQAFLRVNPRNRLVPMMVKWLTLQARGNHWESTKSTAMAVSALAEYIRINKELDVDYTLKVNLNGQVARTYRVTSENALYFDNRFMVNDLFLQDGANKITIEKQGRGNVYWSAALEYFSLEEPIKSAGNEIAIKRRYYKLTRNPALRLEQAEATPTATGKPKPAASARATATPEPPEYLRQELKDGDQLQSGDTVEVELLIESENDYSYLVFEDMKAAAMEPVELRSGGSWGDGLCSNVELRDEKVAFFVDQLPQGRRVLTYRMRAETPGTFHALPTNGYAMYAPEVRAISDEQRLGVRD